jgi:hypothetical protein
MTCNTDYLRMHAQVLSKLGSKRHVFLTIQEQRTSELHQNISKTSSNRAWVGFTNHFHNGHRIHAQKVTRSLLLSSLRTSHTHVFLKSWQHVKTWFSPKQAYMWLSSIYSFHSKSAPTCSTQQGKSSLYWSTSFQFRRGHGDNAFQLVLTDP